MRKAARKQKKLDKLREKVVSEPQLISLNTTYKLPPYEEINILISDQPQVDSSKLVRVKITEFKELAGALAKSETIQRLICPGYSELIKYVTEALKFNTSVKFLQFTQAYSVDTVDIVGTILEYVGEILSMNKITAFMFNTENVAFSTTEKFGRFVNGIRNNTSLTSLYLPGYTFTPQYLGELVEAINLNPSITDLTFHIGFHLQIGGAQHFGPLMAANNIRRLYLENRFAFTPGTCTALFEGLKENTSLTELCLAKKAVRALSCSLSDLECDLLAEALRVNKTLTRLNLNGNKAGCRNIAKILESLQDNQSLTELHFWDNDLNSSIASSIRPLIESNESITELDLPNLRLTDFSCELFGPALAKNKTITSLNLFMNNITSKGCKALAEGLKLNKALIRLNLQGCQIGDEGCIYLAEAIKTNQCLLHLNVSGQPVKAAGLKALIEGLKANEALMDLVVSKDKHLPEELHSEIIALQNKNKQYQRDLKVNTITMIIQIGRSETFELFPLEIWLRIFKYFVCGGVPGFNYIAETILMQSDVRDLKSLLKMRIVTINGKSHFVPRTIT